MGVQLKIDASWIQYGILHILLITLIITLVSYLEDLWKYAPFFNVKGF